MLVHEIQPGQVVSVHAMRRPPVPAAWVCQKVARLLKTKIVEEVHNHHNFAWKETQTIDGCELPVWVVRKGATPAFPGQRGFVGGSMGAASVILEGVESEDSKKSLYSTVHGAGRGDEPHAGGGQEASWDKRARGFVRKSEGEISPAMMKAWVNEAGVELRGGGTDASPQDTSACPRYSRRTPTRAHHPHADPGWRGDGGRRRVRPLQGLTKPRSVAACERARQIACPALGTLNLFARPGRRACLIHEGGNAGAGINPPARRVGRANTPVFGDHRHEGKILR